MTHELMTLCNSLHVEIKEDSEWTKENCFYKIEMIGGITKEQIRSASRLTPIVAARHSLCYILYDKLGVTLLETGKIVNRDHATIIHGNKRVEAALEKTDPSIWLYKQHINLI